MEQKRSYYANIPATVRYDRNLPIGARLLYGEITALCNEKGFCWAGNQYFAELYDNSVSTIKRWISALEDGGYIVRNYRYKDGTKEIDERCITIHDVPAQKCAEVGAKMSSTPVQKCDDPRFKNEPENNTKNNTVNNTPPIVPREVKQEKKRAAVTPLPVPAEIFDQWTAWVDMREKKRKPLTAYAHNLALGKLEKIAPGNYEKQRQILDTSTLSGWTDLYPLKAPAKSAARNIQPQSPSSYGDADELERLLNERGIL